jgi:3-dehydroquinate synthase
MKITVKLGSRAYPIFIGANYLSDASLLADIVAKKKVCVVTNTTVSALYADKVTALLGGNIEALVVLADGEQYKNLASIERIFDAALEHKLNRSSIFVALGGGVIGDMTGFAAACYQRGIDFIQIPTTLLSQVDSSVGGKTGVNHVLGKNMIGAFHQPKAVIIDTDTLKTLPSRELAAGLAEVIKYGLIADADFFSWLEANIEALNACNAESLTYAIQRSCEIKAGVVAEDEFETTGRRAILNLGHTFGHAIETHQGYGSWLHGEAVAVGMVMAVDLSYRLGWLAEDILLRTKALITKAHLPVFAPNNMTVDDFIKVMAVDKKNIHGEVRLILLTALGSAIITDDYNSALMRQVIQDNIDD